MRFPRCLPLVAVLGLLVAGCGSSATAPDSGSGVIRVVAAENFWGSIAKQLGGSKASVQSVIVDPAQDPHDYEPRPADARAFAGAQLAIVNGIGYDSWASKVLAANASGGQRVLSVGELLGLKPGDNPHRWYDPSDVERVASAITASLKKLDPHSRYYFNRQLARFETSGLRGYRGLIASIKHRYAGTAVGASESIFALLAPALDLRLITPTGFMKAISEGTDVSPQDTITTQRQLANKQIRVWVYNSQNTTPVIQHLNALARSRGIQSVTVTETLSPATYSFEQWQAAQLANLARALHEATGR